METYFLNSSFYIIGMHKFRLICLSITGYNMKPFICHRLKVINKTRLIYIIDI